MDYSKRMPSIGRLEFKSEYRLQKANLLIFSQKLKIASEIIFTNLSSFIKPKISEVGLERALIVLFAILFTFCVLIIESSQTVQLSLASEHLNSSQFIFSDRPDIDTLAFDSSNSYLQRAKVSAVETLMTKYNAPLKTNAHSLVKLSEENGMDWKFLASVALVESSGGKQIPHNSFNPFGWGVTSTSTIRFESFDSAIHKVAKEMNKNYISRGLVTVEQIENKYNPSSVERGRTWSKHVRHFYSVLENELSTQMGATASL